MTTVRLWRFESAETGWGIYGEGIARRAGMPTDFSQDHPDPDLDPSFRNLLLYKFKFAFASLADVARWVYDTSWYEALAQHGVVVREISIDFDAVVFGRGQAVYDFKHHSLRIEKTYTPAEFLELVTS